MPAHAGHGRQAPLQAVATLTRTVSTPTARDEVIHTTANHPWLTADHGWLVAGHLQVGEPVRLLDGATARVVMLQTLPGVGPMWDLSLDSVHAFAVGDVQAVVHNVNCFNSPPLSIDDGQFGAKVGKHAADFGLDPADPEARVQIHAIINDIHDNFDEVRQGPRNPKGGGGSDYLFYRQGANVVVTQADGQFVTILQGGETNGWFQRAIPVAGP